MTVAKAVGLHGDVYTAVSGAVAAYSLTVYDHPPATPPAEFVRLDGFDISDLSFKADEAGRHSFEVHHFDRPVGNDNSRNRRIRSKTVLGAIHAALMAASIQGKRLHHEYLSVATEPDGITAHGISRYTLILV